MPVLRCRRMDSPDDERVVAAPGSPRVGGAAPRCADTRRRTTSWSTLVPQHRGAGGSYRRRRGDLTQLNLLDCPVGGGHPNRAALQRFHLGTRQSPILGTRTNPARPTDSASFRLGRAPRVSHARGRAIALVSAASVCPSRDDTL